VVVEKNGPKTHRFFDKYYYCDFLPFLKFSFSQIHLVARISGPLLKEKDAYETLIVSLVRTFHMYRNAVR
jgi:hypothetical protein